MQLGSNFRVRWPKFVIRFDLRPEYLSVLVEDINRWVWNSIKTFSGIGRVVQPIGIDRFVARIGKEREDHFTLAILRDLFAKLLDPLGRIDADGDQFEFVIFLFQGSELGQLPGTVRSPIAPVKDQHNRPLDLR